MSIQVNFMPPISNVTGVVQVDLQPAPRTVGGVMDKLMAIYPALRDELYDEKGRLDYLYQVALNGATLARSRVMEQLVQDGDRLHIFAALSGG